MTLQGLLHKSSGQTAWLNPAVKIASEKLIERCYNQGIEIRIVSGYRSPAEQQVLFNQGRTTPGNIVTNARPGRSNHNYGLAIDFVLIKSGYDMKADTDGNSIADWIDVVTHAKTLGFAWGGDWTSFKDYPHFEMMFGLNIDQLQAGRRPTAAQEKAVIDKIKALEVLPVDEKRIYELEQKVATLTDAVSALNKRVNIESNQTVPKAYEAAVIAAKAAGAITTSNDKSKAELNMIQMLYNMGLYDSAFKVLIAKAKEGDSK